MSFNFNKTLIRALAATCFAAVIGNVSAQQPTTAEEYDQALQALPELSDDDAKPNQTRSGSVTMKCFVDTFAFDEFTSPNCFSNGNPRTTTAVFRIDNEPSNFTIFWSDSRCDSNNDTCFLPISHFQTITLDATVLNNDNNTFSTTSATAIYESFD